MHCTPHHFFKTSILQLRTVDHITMLTRFINLRPHLFVCKPSQGKGKKWDNIKRRKCECVISWGTLPSLGKNREKNLTGNESVCAQFMGGGPEDPRQFWEITDPLIWDAVVTWASQPVPSDSRVSRVPVPVLPYPTHVLAAGIPTIPRVPQWN